MYLSHGGTQAGRVQSDPTGDPFVCGQCSTTGQLSIRSGLRMFQVLPVTVTSNQVAVMHHMPGLPVRVGVPVLARVEALAQLPRPVRRTGACTGRPTPAGR
jgi:hypothetical protein